MKKDLKLYRQGYFLIEVKVTKYARVHKEKWLAKFNEVDGRELSSKTYLVNVLSREMGRLKVGNKASFVKRSIFSNEYFLNGNPNCSRFCRTHTGVIISK